MDTAQSGLDERYRLVQTSPEFSLRIWLGKPTLGRG
jgi:hypothetical protein